MTEQGWAAWEGALLAVHGLPVAEAPRTVAEILAAPPSAEERRQLRAEETAAEERRAEVRDRHDSEAAQAFMRAVNGTLARTTGDVLADGSRDPVGRADAGRRRAAIEALRPLGLDDVITGGDSGCVLDPNVGIIEAPRDMAQRAAMDREYEFRRAEVEVAERNRAVDRYRERLEERWRAHDLDGVRFR